MSCLSLASFSGLIPEATIRIEKPPLLSVSLTTRRKFPLYLETRPAIVASEPGLFWSFVAVNLMVVQPKFSFEMPISSKAFLISSGVTAPPPTAV